MTPLLALAGALALGLFVWLLGALLFPERRS